MPRLPPLFGISRGLAICSLALLGAVESTGATAEVNFSTSLSATQFHSTGLDRLSRDQLAVLDVEVQRDSNDAALSQTAGSTATFSTRRAAVQRSRDGLALLTSGEIAQLDALVAQRLLAKVSLTTANPSSMPVARHDGTEAAWDAWETGPRLPEIHGSVSLTFGTGKGGSFYGGDFQAVYEDPAHRFAVGFGYAEYHGKGLIGAGGCGTDVTPLDHIMAVR